MLMINRREAIKLGCTVPLLFYGCETSKATEVQSQWGLDSHIIEPRDSYPGYLKVDAWYIYGDYPCCTMMYTWEMIFAKEQRDRAVKYKRIIQDSHLEAAQDLSICCNWDLCSCKTKIIDRGAQHYSNKHYNDLSDNIAFGDIIAYKSPFRLLYPLELKSVSVFGGERQGV